MMTNSYYSKVVLCLIAVLLAPTAVYACQPIPQLMITFVGPAPWGAYALKSLLGLLFVVTIKCVLFGYKEKSLKLAHAFVFMFIANMFSTLPGIVGVVVSSVPMFLVLSIPVLYLLYLIPAKYIARHFSSDKINPTRVIIALIAMTIISSGFFAFSQNYVGISNWAYWPLKIVFATLGVSVGLAITIGFEEAVICSIYKRIYKEEKSFLQSVVWANVWAMFIATGFAAAAALPSRFSSPDFLISLIQYIRLLVG